MASDVEFNHSLNPVSLGYYDPDLEADYQSYQPALLIRSLRPLLLALLPALTVAGSTLRATGITLRMYRPT